MGKIKLLDELTVQKIAAGEVIERPASIVKELVENSIDANSDNIIIEINNGGKTFIRVTDDGDGIDYEDIHLAFESHSTSKLRKIDDIYNIMTLGFRGEALPSIAAVSKMEVLTKTGDTTAGIHAIIEEGKIKSIDKVGTPKGTTMIVKDLFYNLPVRKKFLKKDLTESNKISDMVNKLAIGNYNISFKLIKDGKIVLKTNNSGDIKENIYTILGKDIIKGLNPIDYKGKGIEIKGYISDNNLSRSNRSHQYLYINGRYIVNFPLTNAIEQNYRSLIPINRYPVFIIYISIDPKEIDINIHPTKQEIKFTGDTDIYGILGMIIKERLSSSLNVPKFNIDDEIKPRVELKQLYNMTDDSDEFKKKSLVFKDYSDVDFVEENPSSSEDNIERDYKKYNFLNNTENIKVEDSFSMYDLNDYVQNDELKQVDELCNLKAITVVFGTYIVAINHELNTIYFIDQHAAHERVMYEKYKKEYEVESINTQQLIAPEIIELTNSEFEKFLNNKTVFSGLGFDVEEFGTNSVAIRGVPLLFGEPSVKMLFTDLIDNIDKNLKSSYDTKVDRLMKLACTSAIKSGDMISNLEIDSLLNDLSKCENPLSCPHGRPTLIKITKRDMEKHFYRIV